MEVLEGSKDLYSFSKGESNSEAAIQGVSSIMQQTSHVIIFLICYFKD